MRIGVDNKQVILALDKPLLVDYGVARDIAETIAKAAYRAQYGVDPGDINSVLSKQLRDRFTDQLRDKMIARFSLMVPQLKDKTPAYIAKHLIDAFMREIA